MSSSILRSIIRKKKKAFQIQLVVHMYPLVLIENVLKSEAESEFKTYELEILTILSYLSLN